MIGLLYACNRPVFVSHLSEENAKITRRKGAGNHYFLSRVVCFNKKCRKFIGWKNKQGKRRFKGYKTPGIPKRYKPEGPIIADNPIATQENTRAVDTANISTSVYDSVERGVPTEFKNATFTSNSYELVPAFREELKGFVLYLLSHPSFNVRITGHTDDVGGKEANQRLSEDRAKAVVDYLILLGVKPSRLSYEGKGDTVPVATGPGASTARANRRVEFEIGKD